MKKPKRIILSLMEGDVSAPPSFSEGESALFEPLHDLALKQGELSLFNFLKSRPRSCFECSSKLKDLGFLDSEIGMIIEKFVEKKYLDDRLFAQYLVESIQEKKPVGELALRFKLKEKGIDRKTIDDILEPFIQEDAIVSQCLLLAQKRWYRFERHSEEEKWDKVYQYLYSRGFKNKTIQKTIDQLKEKI